MDHRSASTKDDYETPKSDDRSHGPLSASPNPESLQFEYRESAFGFLRDKLKSGLFKYLTKNSANLFLRGRDIISIDPQTVGVHEPRITSLIDYFASTGYSDFLIDIGANIGLTSCQNGNSFKRVDMFEPNPHCCKILEVNSTIALHSTEYHIHHYGLGDEDKKSTLWVPRHNWGGAFINDKANSYDENDLARKDEFQSLTKSNYFTIDIEIRKASFTLTMLLKELVDANLSSGVVKIDVEGYESEVLRGLAEAIPSQVQLFVVFESWKAVDVEKVVELFKGRAIAYKIVRQVAWKRTWPTAIKAAAMLLKPKISHRVIANRTHDWRGDIVLQITPCVAT